MNYKWIFFSYNNRQDILSFIVVDAQSLTGFSKVLTWIFALINVAYVVRYCESRFVQEVQLNRSALNESKMSLNIK